MRVDPTVATAGETVTFTFVFANTTGAIVFDSAFTNDLGLVFYGPERVTTCSSPSLGEIQLKPGLEIANHDALTCTFPYLVTPSDAIAGQITATVTLTVASVGSTSASVTLPAS